MTSLDPRLLALASHGLPAAPPLSPDGWNDSRVDEAIRHGIAGLVRAAHQTGLIHLGTEAAQRIEDQFEAEAIRAVQLEGELIRLSPALRALPVVVLKGAVLARGLVSDPSLRPFTDIDLLVPDRSFDRTVAQLQTFGYERSRPEPAPGYDSRVGKALVLVHPGGTVIDLHRTLAAGRPGAHIDTEHIVAHRIDVPLASISIPAPTWEAHLVEVALHATVGDGLERIISLRDVALVAHRRSLDASQAVDLAAAWGVGAEVALALHRAAEAFGALPAGPLATLASAAPPAADAPKAVRSARNRIADLRTADLGRRLILTRAMLAPSAEFLRFRYGDGPTAPLYGQRWADLLRRAHGATFASPAGATPAAAPTPDAAAGTGRAHGPRVPDRIDLRGAAVDGRGATRTFTRRPRDENLITRFVAGDERIRQGSSDSSWRPPRPENRSLLPHEPDVSGPGDTTPDVPGLDDQTRRVDAGSGPRTAHGVSLFLAGTGLLVLTAIGVQLGVSGPGRYTVPIAGALLAVAMSRRIRRIHPDEHWVGRWLVAGVMVKLVASYLRYLTLIYGYEGVGDASGYDRVGRQLAGAWLEGSTAPELANLRRTNFIRWFTGAVYYVFGTDMLAGFFVFGLLAVVGSYLWFRATVDAVPMIDKRLYLGLVLFVPSIAFWPSSIGKEALMQLGIGTIALGTSLLVRQRLVPGVAVSAAGGWLLWVVRPHLLALVTVAAGVAYLVGRVRSSDHGVRSLLGRPLGLVVMIVAMGFTINQGADFLGIEDLSLSSIEESLDEQTERSAQGGSEFDNGGNSLNPIHLPRNAATVLLRPFPWETEQGLQLLASAESTLIALLLIVRFASLKTSLVQARARPFLLYCWALTLLYAATFSSFANFGLLVRQRSLVLPALLALACIRPERTASTSDTVVSTAARPRVHRETS